MILEVGIWAENGITRISFLHNTTYHSGKSYKLEGWLLEEIKRLVVRNPTEWEVLDISLDVLSLAVYFERSHI